MPTWLTHGWRACLASPTPPPCQLPPGPGPEQARLERASRIPCQPPTPTPTGPGRNPECAAPTLGGPPQDQPITSYWQSWSWERSGESRLGPAAAQAPEAPGRGAFSPEGHPGWGLALIGWARGSVYRQPSLWRREPGGEGGAGASGWKSEALGSACLMKERGANGDTEILIRGSLWGGIYYSVLIG